MNIPEKAVVLITGASGFIGAAVCRELRRSFPQLELIGFSRSEARAGQLEKLGISRTLTSLTDEAARSVLKRVTHVVHAAANARFSSKADYAAENVAPLVALLDALKGGVLERFVFISSIGAVDRKRKDTSTEPLGRNAEPHPTSNYGRSKWAGEEAVAHSSFDYCIVRPPWVYGQGMRLDSHLAVLFAAALRARPISRVAFPGEVSVIHVDDLAKAVTLALFDPALSKQRVFVSEEMPVRLGEVLAYGLKQSEKGSLHTWQIKIPSFTRKLLESSAAFLPFSAKVVFLGALTCRNTLGELTGWKPIRSWESEKQAVLAYVKNPSGLTVVTGAASGLGLEIARELAGRGYNLFLLDRDERLGELAKELKAQWMVLDVSKEEAVVELERAIATSSQILRGIIHVAGFGIRSEFASGNYEDIRRIFQTNTLFPIQSTSRLLPMLSQTAGSFLVFVCSSIATAPLPGMSLYGSTKSALYSFGRSLAAELHTKTPHVLVVLPAGMKTNFQSSSGVKVLSQGKGLLDPKKVAKSIVVALEEKKNFLSVGFLGNLVPRASSFFPQKVQLSLWRMLMRKMR